MYKKAQWTADEISKLEPSLRSAVEEGDGYRSKKERYFDEKTGKYKFRSVETKKSECPECKALFYKNRPKQIFCQDFCRIRYWQKDTPT